MHLMFSVDSFFLPKPLLSLGLQRENVRKKLTNATSAKRSSLGCWAITPWGWELRCKELCDTRAAG